MYFPAGALQQQSLYKQEQTSQFHWDVLEAWHISTKATFWCVYHLSDCEVSCDPPAGVTSKGRNDPGNAGSSRTSISESTSAVSLLMYTAADTQQLLMYTAAENELLWLIFELMGSTMHRPMETSSEYHLMYVCMCS